MNRAFGMRLAAARLVSTSHIRLSRRCKTTAAGLEQGRKEAAASQFGDLLGVTTVRGAVIMAAPSDARPLRQAELFFPELTAPS
jgi:hypothetical protein